MLLPTRTSKLRFIWVNPVNFKFRLSENKETLYHVNMLKKLFERDIMACLNVISSLANTDVHSKDDVMSD